jgi:hypothetical protein
MTQGILSSAILTVSRTGLTFVVPTTRIQQNLTEKATPEHTARIFPSRQTALIPPLKKRGVSADNIKKAINKTSQVVRWYS